MNAHALSPTRAVPSAPPVELPTLTWGELMLELRDARADFASKVHLTDSIALGREATEHETAIAHAAIDREITALRSVLAYAPPTLHEFVAKAASLGDEELVVGFERECLEALVRDAQALKAADAALIKLESNLSALWSMEKLISTPEAPDDVVTEACNRTGKVAAEMMALPPALTVEGMRAKVRAIAWCFSEDRPEFSSEHGHPTAADRWADQFFAELLAGAPV